MAYERYRRKMSIEEFVSSWDTIQSEAPKSQHDKDMAYKKYSFRVSMLNRDKFTCQNVGCRYCNNIKDHDKLEIHRIKAGRNGGKYIPRNSVLVCRPSHKNFNRKKDSLTFSNKENIPAHVRGMTFNEHKEKRIDWKAIKAENLQIRKREKYELEVKGLLKVIKEMPIGKRAWYGLTFTEILILFKWLDSYCEDD